MSKMKLWRCPKCKEEIKAIAHEVTHRCKNMKNNAVTKWDQVGKDDE